MAGIDFGSGFSGLTRFGFREDRPIFQGHRGVRKAGHPFAAHSAGQRQDIAGCYQIGSGNDPLSGIRRYRPWYRRF